MSEAIRTKAVPKCACCHSEGTYLYQNLKDRLFGVNGLWHLKKCNNSKCGLIWQDPVPIEEDLYLLYQNYFTHQDSHEEIKSSRSIFEDIIQSIKQGYLANNYGYSHAQTSLLKKTLGYLMYLFPTRRAWVDSEVFYLPSVQNGKLLEIGCGAGNALKVMKSNGWDVTGLDFDQKAVNNCKEKGMNVFLGSLMDKRFDDNTFDAIVMSHVLEHVPDPKHLVNEIYRVLKTDGVFISITPNTKSLTHLIYKKNYLNLDPPRHLNLFNIDSSFLLLKDIGFKKVDIKATIRGFSGAFIASNHLKNNEIDHLSGKTSFWHKVFGKIGQLILCFLIKFDKNLGEEILIKAVK